MSNREMVNMSNVLFDDEARDKLILGVNLIANTVGKTFGPNGRNVFIKTPSGLHITKDGATVAKFVEDEDPYINMGVDLVRKIAMKTADDVGDGTTTATILSKEIINTLSILKEHPIKLSRDLKSEVNEIITFLDKNKKNISCKEDLIKVATVSTNNDTELGELIGGTYFTVGKHGVVTVEESKDTVTKVSFSGGVKIPSGYSSPFFINTEKNECILENVYIYITNKKIDTPKELLPICDKAIKEQKQLVIISPKIDSSVIRALLINSDSGVLKSCCVTPPSNGRFREDYLRDIKNTVGEYANKVIVGKDSTIFIGGTRTEEICKIEAETIQKFLSDPELSETEQQIYVQRLANYLGSIATIFVGGFSEVEIKEKKDRIEDAICAVRAAFLGGILPGGGIALVKAAKALSSRYLIDVLRAPERILNNNAGLISPCPTDDFWSNPNPSNHEEILDYNEVGILDPFLVTKTALENAVSAASLVLTSGCTILNV